MCGFFSGSSSFYILEDKINLQKDLIPLRRITYDYREEYLADQLFYLPISHFLEGDEQFRKTIINYVGARDGKLHQ
jgi:hypothetical protein